MTTQLEMDSERHCCFWVSPGSEPNAANSSGDKGQQMLLLPPVPDRKYREQQQQQQNWRAATFQILFTDLSFRLHFQILSSSYGFIWPLTFIGPKFNQMNCWKLKPELAHVLNNELKTSLGQQTGS